MATAAPFPEIVPRALSPEQQAIETTARKVLAYAAIESVDTALLIAALEQVLSTHQILRHAFVRRAGQTQQHCLPQMPQLTLLHFDLSQEQAAFASWCAAPLAIERGEVVQ